MEAAEAEEAVRRSAAQAARLSAEGEWIPTSPDSRRGFDLFRLILSKRPSVKDAQRVAEDLWPRMTPAEQDVYKVTGRNGYVPKMYERLGGWKQNLPPHIADQVPNIDWEKMQSERWHGLDGAEDEELTMFLK